MLTRADCDLRKDPGSDYPLHVRVMYRHCPGYFDENDLPRFKHAPELLHAAQSISGALVVPGDDDRC